MGAHRGRELPLAALSPLSTELRRVTLKPGSEPHTWLIENARGAQVPRLLHELKALHEDGWDVTALLAPDGSVVGLGVGTTPTERLGQQSLFAEVAGGL